LAFIRFLNSNKIDVRAYPGDSVRDSRPTRHEGASFRPYRSVGDRVVVFNTHIPLRAHEPTMTDRAEVAAVERVCEEGSYLFTVTDAFDVEQEVVLVPCREGDRVAGSEGDHGGTSDDADEADVAAWINRCTHEAQRFDTGRGVPMRDGQIVCPRHGSMFDACSGACDNGEAAGTTLPAVEVAVEDGTVYLTDEDYALAHEGGINDGDGDGPSSTSHVGF
jgi:nitrite reductase/ring-hydroxylating ferredoxin subunit